MSYEQVKLQFRSTQDIWSFLHATHTHNFQINTKGITLSCGCKPAEVELAINGYSAVIMRADDLFTVKQ